MSLFKNLKAVFAMIACAVFVAMTAAAPALATDGVIEINQAKVTASGGFPYVISQPGSYRLTSNLTVPDKDTDGISITADNVSIDLNGFAIQGPNVCTGIPANCSLSGSGVGIKGSNVAVSVSNGTISGMGHSGIVITGDLARVERVTSKNNGQDGIMIEDGLVRDSVVRSNGGNGIYGGGKATIQSVVSVGNHWIGIYATTMATITDSAISHNGNWGILASGQAFTISCNTVTWNANHGISAGGSVVSNTIAYNGGYGLHGLSVAYSQNTFTSNNSGGAQVGGTALQVPAASNICNGAICP